MTTERMTNERRNHLAEFPGKWCTSQQEEVNAELTRARRVEQEQAATIRLQQQSIESQKNTIAELREMLRLTNDKMAERVRAAKLEVAEEALSLSPPNANTYLHRVKVANTPKD